MNSENEVLIFLHIPKTAGSTFHMIMNGRYKKDSVYNVFGSRYTDPEIKRFIELPESDKSHIRLLKGHMPFGLHKHLASPCRYITVLRNPVERVISQYYYVKKNEFNPLHEQVEGGAMSITEFVSSGISVGMNNGQCRFINGDIDEYGFDQCDDSLLENVRKNIREHFIWLGLTERFDESVLVLARLLGWHKPPNYIRENVSKTRKSRSSFSDEEIAVIKKYNALDVQLYEEANRRLDEEIANIPGFEDLLAEFKAKNQKLQQRWGWLPDKLRRYVV